jgi:hypothetical protein
MAIKGVHLSDPPLTATRSSRAVPWQIWVTVILLGLEGVGNLLAIPQEPAAAEAVAFKCLFIVGLIRGWRWVFALFLVVASLHVLAFSGQAPFVAFLNLVLVLLVGSTLRYFFPRNTCDMQAAGAKLVPLVRSIDPDFDA